MPNGQQCKITPTKHFEWHDCFDIFKCARLRVPMDWNGNTAEADLDVGIAVIKIEASVPVPDPTYGGAVVLNPGGPGNSSVTQVLKEGFNIRTLLSAGPGANNETAKDFDVVSFDPRGMNNTRPNVLCFPDRQQEAAFFFESDTQGAIGTSNTAFDNA